MTLHNTGGKDFIYDDNFVELLDGFRHSKWLSFMTERLKIADKLLTQNGILVISIGYHEVHNLVLLCEEIFIGKQITCVTVQTSGGKPNGGFTYVQEYLVYVTPESFVPNTMSFTGGKERSPFEGLTLSTFDKTTRPNQTYPIFIDNQTKKMSQLAEFYAWFKDGYEDGKLVHNDSELTDYGKPDDEGLVVSDE